MATSNFSYVDMACQLVRAHIERYLAGEKVPESVLRDLELHIGECPSCQLAVTNRENELRNLLGNDVISQAGISPAEEKEPLKKLIPPLEKSLTSKRMKNWGRIAIAVTLVGLLLFLGYFADPKTLLGQKVLSPENTPEHNLPSKLKPTQSPTVNTELTENALISSPVPQNQEAGDSRTIQETPSTHHQSFSDLPPTPLKLESRSTITESVLSSIKKQLQVELGDPATSQTVQNRKQLLEMPKDNRLKLQHASYIKRVPKKRTQRPVLRKARPVGQPTSNAPVVKIYDSEAN